MRHCLYESVMCVSSQERGSRSQHQCLLEAAEGWTEEACHRLQTGERLSHHDMTMYRYFCLATLMVTHQKSERTVADVKVMYYNVPRSRFLFPCNFDSHTLQLFCVLAHR